jgi:uncharacterized protein
LKDWYHQRAQAAKDKELVEHNRDEEKEHEAMLLERLRRQDEDLSGELKEFLSAEGDIAEMEKD